MQPTGPDDPRGTARKKTRKRRARPIRKPRATISASEFKAKCLKIMDEVRDMHEQVIITKYGEPVAKLVPVNDEVPDSFGSLSGTVAYQGDIVAPDREAWDDPAE